MGGRGRVAAADSHGDGFGLASNGLLAFTVNTADGKTQLVLGTPPPAAPAPAPTTGQ